MLRHVLVVGLLLAAAPVWAQQQESAENFPLCLEQLAISRAVADRQEREAVGRIRHQAADYEARLSTLIEWLKAAQATTTSAR